MCLYYIVHKNSQQWHENVLERLRVNQGERTSKGGIPELRDRSTNLLSFVWEKHTKQGRQHGKHLIVMQS